MTATTSHTTRAPLLAPGAPWLPWIVGIGAVTGAAPAVEGAVVRKSGRTTGLRTGTVTSTDYTTSVDFGPGIGWHTLREQVRISGARLD